MNKNIFLKQSRLILTSISIIFLLVACGGGGSSSDTAENQDETQATPNPSDSATESTFKAIAGKWQVTFKDESIQGFKFTIDLNGVGLKQGKIIQIGYDPERDFISIHENCKNGATECDTVLFGTLNSGNTKIDGFDGRVFNPRELTAVKIQ